MSQFQIQERYNLYITCLRIPLKEKMVVTFPASALYYCASTNSGEDKEPVLKLFLEELKGLTTQKRT